jgi:NADPH-dependent curcumin reductase CurA
MSPKGALGRKIILPLETVQAALHTLLGMAVSYKDGWDGHNNRLKVGVITESQIVGKRVLIEGFIYAKDFPEVIEMCDSRLPLGMSFEADNLHVEDTLANNWTIEKMTFTGAAIMHRYKASFANTSFQLGVV